MSITVEAVFAARYADRIKWYQWLWLFFVPSFSMRDGDTEYVFKRHKGRLYFITKRELMEKLK